VERVEHQVDTGRDRKRCDREGSSAVVQAHRDRCAEHHERRGELMKVVAEEPAAHAHRQRARHEPTDREAAPTAQAGERQAVEQRTRAGHERDAAEQDRGRRATRVDVREVEPEPERRGIERAGRTEERHGGRDRKRETDAERDYACERALEVRAVHGHPRDGKYR